MSISIWRYNHALEIRQGHTGLLDFLCLILFYSLVSMNSQFFDHKFHRRPGKFRSASCGSFQVAALVQEVSPRTDRPRYASAFSGGISLVWLAPSFREHCFRLDRAYATIDFSKMAPVCGIRCKQNCGRPTRLLLDVYFVLFTLYSSWIVRENENAIRHCPLSCEIDQILSMIWPKLIFANFANDPEIFSQSMKNFRILRRCEGIAEAQSEYWK